MYLTGTFLSFSICLLKQSAGPGMAIEEVLMSCKWEVHISAIWIAHIPYKHIEGCFIIVVECWVESR